MKTGLFIALVLLMGCGTSKDSDPAPINSNISYWIKQINYNNEFTVMCTTDQGRITTCSIDTGGSTPLVININIVNSYLITSYQDHPEYDDTIGRVNSYGDLYEIYGYDGNTPNTGDRTWDTTTITYNVNRIIVATDSKIKCMPVSGPIVNYHLGTNYSVIGNLTVGYNYTNYNEGSGSGSYSGTFTYYDTLDQVGIYNAMNFIVGYNIYNVALGNMMTSLNIAQMFKGYFGRQFPKLIKKRDYHLFTSPYNTTYTYGFDINGRPSGVTSIDRGTDISSKYFSY